MDNLENGNYEKDKEKMGQEQKLCLLLSLEFGFSQENITIGTIKRAFKSSIT
jgi:hypothetical protein